MYTIDFLIQSVLTRITIEQALRNSGEDAILFIIYTMECKIMIKLSSEYYRYVVGVKIRGSGKTWHSFLAKKVDKDNLVLVLTQAPYFKLTESCGRQ